MKKEKIKQPGNFNVGVNCSLFDKNFNYIGNCFHAPNPIIEAINKNPAISFIESQYPQFAAEIVTKEYYTSGDCYKAGTINKYIIQGD